MELVEATESSIERAVASIRKGQVIAYPTETLYGLGVDPFNEDALERLFAAKGRDRDQAVLLVIGGPEHLRQVTPELSDRARGYMNTFWPGPLSLLLPRHSALPDAVAPGRGKICVRCPGLPWVRDLCTAFGGPITSTSANASGQPPVQDLRDLSLPGVRLGFDAGPLPSIAPSTIIDGETGEVLREGAVSRTQLSDAARNTGIDGPWHL